jgi:PilZ domain
MGLFRDGDEFERRREPRSSPETEICCAIRDPRSGCWFSAAVRDISATGISLLTNAPFDPERLLTIELRNPKSGFARKYLVEVRHADICCPNDAWLQGCRFIHPLDEDELRLLL